MTTAQKKQLDEIEKEWVSVAYERRKYTADNSENGYKLWKELWDRGIELGKQRDKLLKEGASNASVVQETIPAQN